LATILLKSKFVKAQDAKRFLAEDFDTIDYFFKLFEELKLKHRVADEDIYNLDEKGVMQGVVGKSRVIIAKYEPNPRTTQSGNREWVTSTECVSATGRKLGSWIIFKGKKILQKWHTKMRDLGLQDSGYHICTSENGWTDNELGLAYLEKHFDPQSAEG
jgi:hypothetical protein